MLVASVAEPLALAIARPPGALGADVVVGEAQSFGVPLSSGTYNAQPEVLPMAAAVEEHGSAGFEAPGTFVLAMVLLISFIVYYFINWKYLASVWPLS